MPRLSQAWQQRVQGQASERKTMEGMQWMSPALTIVTFKKKDPQQQALLRAKFEWYVLYRRQTETSLRKTEGLKGLTCVSFVPSLTPNCIASGYVPILQLLGTCPKSKLMVF